METSILLVENFINKICEDWGAIPPTILFQNRLRGEVEYKNGGYIICYPTWLFECSYPYFIYYIIHELTHILTLSDHSERFKQIENELCNCYSELRIEYDKEYAKAIYDLKTNTLL